MNRKPNLKNVPKHNSARDLLLKTIYLPYKKINASKTTEHNDIEAVLSSA
jgi:hypothetical protein